MSYVQLDFYSRALGFDCQLNIVLPEEKQGVGLIPVPRKEKHPVLYLLHGTSGDHSDWERWTSVERYAAKRGLAVVMMAGQLSSYANMAHGQRFFDYVAYEVPEIVRDAFPISDKREDNFIAGLSMGGRGTCVYAFNHPEKFAAAAILSACPRDVMYDKAQGNSMFKRTQGSIDNRGGLEAYLASYENTWRVLDEKAHTGELPKLYFAIGTNDFLYDAFKHFRAHAEEIGLDATFEEIPGYKHEWRFWDLTIQKALTFFGLDQTDAGNPF